MSDRLLEYFAREAREYLDHLDEMLRGSGVPDAAELLRLARGVRGSAQMALADGIALAAEKLEDAASSLVSGEIGWDQELRTLAVATVHDLKELVAALSRWGPAEDDRAREARNRWGGSGAGAGASSSPAAVSIESLFYDDSGPHIMDSPAGFSSPRGSDAIPVEELLFRGSSALQEALTLRPRLEELVHSADRDDGRLDEVMEELFDLVRLGIERDTPSA